MTLRKPSKAARRQALHEFLANLPEPPELPDEAEDITTSEIGVAKSITIVPLLAPRVIFTRVLRRSPSRSAISAR